MDLKKIILLLIFSLTVFSAPVLSAGAPPVKSFYPTGTTTENPRFKVVFASAAVSEDMVGAPLAAADFPFEVRPAILADGRWETADTFTADLIAPLPGATAFTASAGGREFSFRTEPLRLLSVSQSSYEYNSGVSTVWLNLEFNIPVSPARLSGFLNIVTLDNRKIGFSCVGNLPSRTITVSMGLTARERKLILTVAKGLTGEVGSLGLEENAVQSAEVNPMLAITDSRATEHDGSIYITTNNRVSAETARRFITIEPKSDFRLEGGWNGFFIYGDFKPRQRVLVNIKKGLPASEGDAILTEDFQKAFIIPDRQPEISFPASGMFLSPAVGTTVPVETVNVSDVSISLWRLYESNLPYAIRYAYYREGFPLDLSARVANKTAKITSAPNEEVRRAIDIKSLVSGDAPGGKLSGLYMLTVSDNDEHWWRQANQIVSLSDIGLTARVWPDGCLVWANSISGAKPVENALIRIYDEACQLIAEGRTDAQGLCGYFPNGGLDGASPVLVTAEKGDDVSFVELNNALITNEAFNTSGMGWKTEGYDGMMFTPRGVYRPGETVNVKAIVREAGSDVPPQFPVLYMVRDPMGRIYTRGTAALSAQGTADMEFRLSDTSSTGAYYAELYVPGNENVPFASVPFSVETFAPPRIEVDLNVSPGRYKDVLMRGETASFDISSKYLFGVPASGMRYTVSYFATKGSFVPSGEDSARWAPFSFSDPEKDRNFYFSDVGELADGYLSGDGQAFAYGKFAWDSPPAVVDLWVSARVMEDSGRWISDGLGLKYFLEEYVLGIESPSDCKAGETVRFRAAALTPDSKPVEKLEVKAELYRILYHYNLVARDGVTRWQTTRELEKAEEKTVQLTQGIAEFEFTPRSGGEYHVRVEAADGSGISASSYLWCSSYADGGGSRLIDKIELVPDKELYKAGETARITVKSPFTGTLLFTAESSTLVSQQVIEMTGVQAEVLVPISADMGGANLWCVASVLRPVKEDEPWTAHRAIGVKSIALDTSEHKLPVEIEAPEKISPNSKLPVRIRAKAGSEIVLALVDDGVLQITGYETPDPHGYFYARRQLASNIHDIYDLLMQVEPRSTELLHPAGGSAMKAAAYMGGMNSKRFKILSLYKPSLIIGESGEAEVVLDVPEHSGRARLFAVAVSGMSFGSAERFVQIARDLVVEANLPRFAAAGDSFFSSLTAFNTSGESMDVTVNLKTEGPLSISGDKSLSLSFSMSPNSSKSTEIPFKADGIGEAKYTAEANWGGGGTFSQEVDIQIRGLYPVVSRVGTGRFVSGDTAAVTLPDDMADGAVMTLSVAGTPVADLVPAVNKLLNYPYGCLEQTVSRAWPLIAVPEAVRMTDPELISQSEISAKLSSCIYTMQAMQLYNGSFGTWPGNQPANNWASVYAAHFLSELKRADVMKPFPEDMQNGVMNFLRQYLAEPADTDNLKASLTTKAYACFVLALEKEAPLGLMYWLKENENDLLPSGRMWLAGAYALSDGKAAHLKELGGALDFNAPVASNPWTLDSTVRNAAQMLLLWTMIQPDAPEAAALAENLIRFGKIGRWYSTQENAVSAVALANYMRANGAMEETSLLCSLTDPSGKIYEPAKQFNARDNKIFPITGPGTWTLKSEGSGSGYYSWVMTGEPKAAPNPESYGVKVETEWLDSKNKKLSGDIKLGTEIRVGVKVIPTAGPLMDVVVSLLLPAGLEIESAPEPGWFRADARDDRLLLFFDNLQTSAEYNYTVRAVTKGDFALPPASAEGMYSPAVRFIGQGSKITIN